MSDYGREGRTGIDFAKNANNPGLNCGTTFLKLEPIKTKLNFTSSLALTGGENYTTDANGDGLTDTWIITSGNTSFSGLINGVIIQFCEYDPVTKIETELFHTTFNVGSSTSIQKTFTFATDDMIEVKKFRKHMSSLARRLKLGLNKTFAEDVIPYLCVYVLPANYVTKQINLSTIQSYWQDPSFPHVMWVQHTSCCSFNSGPFNATIIDAEGETPAAIGQTALTSKATTGIEVFHNIIPYLDTIMTYAN